MMDLYQETCNDCSKIITKKYSTSFSMGINAFDEKYRAPIYAIYGLVRFADEIVDTFHDFDKARLLEEFKQEAKRAIDEKISLNPVLQAYQIVHRKYNIDWELVNAFFESMEMDLHKNNYETYECYNKYIYGSAEVVGLMCLKVFCEEDEKNYEVLKPYAKSLGAAFQKVNFLRDMQSDFNERGRVYFPNMSFNEFDETMKAEIVQDIKKDFDHAYIGIMKLPKGSKLGVYLAYIYYLKLFEKIKSSPIKTMLNERIRIPDNTKVFLLVNTMLKHYFRMI